MKRSEMINIINEALKDVKIPGYDERLPDRILYFVEQAGMLPPCTPKYLNHELIQNCKWDVETFSENLDNK